MTIDRLFIAEKPSMGKAIAQELAALSGNSVRQLKTHAEVGADVVTWGFGHLLELVPPEVYDPKYERWIFEDLPIFPPQWKLRISKGKKDQVDAIRDLLKQASRVVHAGDPGREGQLIVDELLLFLNNRKPTERILLNALDPHTIRTALQKMENNQKFQPLFKAGQARSHADWTMGYNLTRGYSVLARSKGFSGGTLSIGRVQTPTLGIVVDRDLKHEQFQPKDFWVPWATFKVANGQFMAKWVVPSTLEVPWLDEAKRILVQAEAQRILSNVAQQTGTVSTFEEKPKKIDPPLSFSLSMLQTYANQKFGFTASETLELCQQLYEAKLVSYPRTDCPYLPTSQKDASKEVIAAIGSNFAGLYPATQKADPTLTSSIWNDKKMAESEHHAIIPTQFSAPQALSALSSNHQKLYDAIAKRYLAQFYPACDARTTLVEVTVQNELFRATGIRELNPGWKVLYGKAELEDENDKQDEDVSTQLFPEIHLQEPALCQQTQLKASRTTPPPRFNDGSLIHAMTNVHQLVDSAEDKARLKEVKGIGTEATRANILDTLVERGFIKREKKQIISTPLGRSLIQLLPPRMIDPALTSLWEHAFDSIAKAPDAEQAAARYKAFFDKLRAWVSHLLVQSMTANYELLPQSMSVKPLSGHGTACPVCKSGQLMTRLIKQGSSKGKTFLGCSNYPTCKHSVFP